MEIQDFSDNHRVTSLSNLAEKLRKSRSPGETMFAVRQTLADVYGHVRSMMLATGGLPEGSFRIVEINLDDAAIEGDNLAPAEMIYSGGVLSSIISSPTPRLVQDVVWDTDPDFAEVMREYGSVVAVPLLNYKLPMTWVLLFQHNPTRFTTVDLEEAMLRVALVASLLESQNMAGDLALANDRVDKEVRQAAKLQRMLLPSPLPQIPQLQMAVSYEPSGRAGGDLFDLFLLDEGAGGPQRWCILMADASGHGLAAAVVMAIVQSIVRAHPPAVSGPAALLSHANDHLCQKKLGGFVTAFVMIYQPELGAWCYASAGHPPPLLKKANGRDLIQLNGASSLPLGIDPETKFTQTKADFNTGDTLLMYTDGITEARNPAGDMFEVDNVQMLLNTSDHGPAFLVEHLQKQVTAHQAGQPAADDQTILAIRIM